MAVSAQYPTTTDAINGMGIGTYTSPVYGLSIQYPVKLPSDPPLVLQALVFEQVAATETNVLATFTINADGTLTDVLDDVYAPADVMHALEGMPLYSDVFSISQADYDAIITLLGV